MLSQPHISISLYLSHIIETCQFTISILCRVVLSPITPTKRFFRNYVQCATRPYSPLPF